VHHRTPTRHLAALLTTATALLTLSTPPAAHARPAARTTHRWIPAHLHVPQGRTSTIVAVHASSDGHLHVTRTHVVGQDQADRLAAALAQDPATVALSVDQPLRLASTPASTTAAYIHDEYAGRQWALGALDVAQAWQSSYGQGVTVAVIDTGVDATQPDLAGRLVPGISYFPGQAADHDGMGHGTQVAGVIAADSAGLVGLAAAQTSEVTSTQGIAGIAPMAKIMPVKVFDDQGYGSSAAIAQGIIWAVDHGAQIINISAGGNAIDPAWMAAISYAMVHEVTIVAAAGNDRSSGSPTFFPAAMDNVIAVAAVNEDLSYTVFSNAGSYIDVAAPGNMLWSTNVDKYWSTPPGESLPRYEEVAGTSVAAPYVAGALALVKSVRPDLTPLQLTGLVQATATDLGPAGRDDDYGYGLVNPVAMLCQVGHCPAALPAPPPGPDTRTPARISAQQVQSGRPHSVYPGDSVMIHVEVTDSRNNPVVGGTVTLTDGQRPIATGYTNGSGITWLTTTATSTATLTLHVAETSETSTSSSPLVIRVSPEPRTRLQLTCTRYGLKVTTALSAGQTLTVQAHRPGRTASTSWVLPDTGQATRRTLAGKPGTRYSVTLTWRGKAMAPAYRCTAPRR